jgi:hypothetical protein
MNNRSESLSCEDSSQQTANQRGNHESQAIHRPELVLIERGLREDLRRRAEHPYRGSPEYQKAIADCIAAHRAEQLRLPLHKSAMWPWEWNARAAVVGVVVAVATAIMLWLGIASLRAAQRVSRHHVEQITSLTSH